MAPPPFQLFRFKTFWCSLTFLFLQVFNHFWLFVTPWPVAHQASLSMKILQARKKGIFPDRGLNQGLLHCRQILYQLSYREAPSFWIIHIKFIRKSCWFCLQNRWGIWVLFTMSSTILHLDHCNSPPNGIPSFYLWLCHPNRAARGAFENVNQIMSLLCPNHTMLSYIIQSNTEGPSTGLHGWSILYASSHLPHFSSCLLCSSHTVLLYVSRTVPDYSCLLILALAFSSFWNSFNSENHIANFLTSFKSLINVTFSVKLFLSTLLKIATPLSAHTPNPSPCFIFCPHSIHDP